MQKNGATWGARPDVTNKAASALAEVVESVLWSGLTKGPVRAEARFDEFNLDLSISYEGDVLDLSPQRLDLESDQVESALAHIAGHLIRQLTDRIKCDSKNGQAKILLHFEH
jgi:xanthine permease XanP